VRTEGLCALVRGGLCYTKSFGWIFGRPFFGSFFGRTKKEQKELNIDFLNFGTRWQYGINHPKTPDTTL
jgi:hypothetical protein